jgi:PKD repeat protein
VVVFFDGSPSTDAEGAVASYSWDFGDASGSVTGKTPAHTFAAAGTFTVRLTVTDSGGLSAATTQSISIIAGGGAGNVTISGRATFERVPFSSTVSLGLDYANTSPKPIREAVVELVQSGGSTLATTTTDSNGTFALIAPANTNVFVRVRAQSRRILSPAHDIRVLNNTNGNALYVLDSAVFNSGAASQAKDLLATSGWGLRLHQRARRGAVRDSRPRCWRPRNSWSTTANSTLDLPALDVFWSTQNTATSGDVALGQIESTLYLPHRPMGRRRGSMCLAMPIPTPTNTTSTSSRTNSTLPREHDQPHGHAGGNHSGNERLDLRLAFSEGFGNAFSAMVLNDPFYSDSLGSRQGQRFSFDMESNAASPAGWFNENSIQSLAWDLFDTARRGGCRRDRLQADVRRVDGVAPIRPGADQRLSIRDDLTSKVGAPTAAINALVASQNIHVDDPWGSTETNNGLVPQALPLYTPLALNGGLQAVCGTTTAGTYNKIGNRLFLRFSIATTKSVTIRAQYTSTARHRRFRRLPIRTSCCTRTASWTSQKPR